MKKENIQKFKKLITEKKNQILEQREKKDQFLQEMVSGDYIDKLTEHKKNQIQFKMQSRERIYLKKLDE